MEILSLPGPDRSITDDNLKQRVLVSRRYRNRRIGDFPLILSSMEANGSDLPVFETDEDRSYFLITLPIHPLFKEKNNNVVIAEKDDKSPQRRSRENIRSQVLDLLTQKGDMSSNEIASALGYKKITDTLREVINEMLASGDVFYLYPDKPKSRNQKICLHR